MLILVFQGISCKMGVSKEKRCKLIKLVYSRIELCFCWVLNASSYVQRLTKPKLWLTKSRRGSLENTSIWITWKLDMGESVDYVRKWVGNQRTHSFFFFFETIKEHMLVMWGNPLVWWKTIDDWTGHLLGVWVWVLCVWLLNAYLVKVVNVMCIKKQRQMIEQKSWLKWT